MSKIRKLYWFDKKNSEEMISFLNDRVNDAYINRIMFNPFVGLHHLLPLKFKFLPESYVLKDRKDIKGLITIAPSKGRHKKMEIQKLLFEENSFSVAADLVQYVVSKYKALGANSIIVKVDDYLPELLSMFISKCGFSQISYEKLWRITKFIDTDFDKREFRSIKNSDIQLVTNLFNDSLLPHFRPLLSKEISEFKESLFKGLSYYNEYKYVMEDKKTRNVIAYISIQTLDNENFVVDIVQTGWANIDVNVLLSYAAYQVKKRKNKFGLFVKSKRYTTIGESLETTFMQNGFECVQNQIVLTNSSAKVLKSTEKNKKFTVLNGFYSGNVTINPVNKISQ